ncbi:MAG: hypothetical protein IJ308_02625 [Clostridia bacterium]|nr:hypothetical protein [Clostridia bacterium]
MRKVVVLFGGKSCEREISVLTGVFAVNILQAAGHGVLPVYIHTDGKTYTAAGMTDVGFFRNFSRAKSKEIFFYGHTVYALNEKKGKIKPIFVAEAALNCCHGGLGEGGGVSALMAWQGIPLASPDLTASGVFIDKCLTKVAMRGLNIPVVDYVRVNERDYQKRGAFLLKTIGSRLKFPVVVKPAHLGSSIGISVAKNEGEAKTAIEHAFAIDDRVIIERYLEDKQDVNCAAYSVGGEIFVSEPEKAFGDGLYSFEEKYVKRGADGVRGKGEISANQGGRYAANGDFSKEIRDKIRAYTRTIYKRMNLKGIVRMDFLLSQGKIYLCEVNTVPGSLAYYLFCERISDAKRLFTAIIEDAIFAAQADKKGLITTGILDGVQIKRK